MKLRLKVVFMNILITIVILYLSGYIVIRTVDKSNINLACKYIRGRSESAEQFLSDYFKADKDPESALEIQRLKLEDMLLKHTGIKVELLGVNIKNPSWLHKNALENKTSYQISSIKDGRELNLSFPIYINGKVIGIGSIEYSLEQADTIRMQLLLIMLVIFFSGILVLFFLSYLFSYRLIKPLEKLTLATREFSRGNFIEIENIKTNDEIEGVARALNKMGQDIKIMLEDLRNEQVKQKKFFDNITHEIRTPLTNIIGYADLMNRRVDDESKRKYISYITGESNRLLRMVNDLLELTKMNSCKYSIVKYEINLNEVVEEAIMLMSDRIKKFGFDIDYDLDEIFMSVDRERIKQVIMNLIDNAIKHSEGSIICVRLWKPEDVFISVSDNGIGIKAEDIDAITESFNRINRSGAGGLRGNGFGLSICKEIAAAHGGSLKIESSEAGTIVTISLHP